MVNKMPDPKVVVDSVIDGAIEVAEGPARVAENLAKVMGTYATDVKSNMETLKTQLPDNPEVIPDAALKAVGQLAQAGIGVIESFGQGAMDTVSAVKKQITRVTG